MTSNLSEFEQDRVARVLAYQRAHAHTFAMGQEDDVQRSIDALARHVSTEPFDPSFPHWDSAAPTVADTLRSIVREFGSDRSQWPAALLRAAEPFDALAQIAAGHAQVVQTPAPASATHPTNVRTHRPHRSNTGADWHPVTGKV